MGDHAVVPSFCSSVTPWVRVAGTEMGSRCGEGLEGSTVYSLSGTSPSISPLDSTVLRDRSPSAPSIAFFVRPLRTKYVPSALRATKATTTVITGVSQVLEPCACSTLAADERDDADTEVEVEVVANGVEVGRKREEDWLERVWGDELLVALETSTGVGVPEDGYKGG